jgi:hypothetical protein
MTFAATRSRAGSALCAGLAAATALTLALAIGGGAHAAVPTVHTDPTGDILPGFIGRQNNPNFDPASVADLDVTQFSGVFSSIDVRLSATMAGDIGTTPNGLYVWGVDRGKGTELLHDLALQHPNDPHWPDIGQGVLFDSFVVVNPNDTGSVFLIDSQGFHSTPLQAGAITHSGRNISVDIPLWMLPGNGFATADYGYNIWPRVQGITENDFVTDFGPNETTFKADAVPEPATWAFLIAGFGLAGTALRRRRILQAA